MYTSTLLSACLALSTSVLAAPQFDVLMYLAKTQPTPSLPSSSLPAPNSGVSLQYIGLGVGTQNYTCATSDSSSTPAAMGAVANLYDITSLLQATSNPSQQKSIQYTPCYADKLNNGLGFKQLGVHYFTAAGVPTFDLSQGTVSAQYPQGEQLSAAKKAVSAAPSGSCTGRDGQAAVPWLMLADNGSGNSRGLSQVYRVETAGGSAPATCSGQAASFTQDYAAEYWFFG